MAGNNNFELYSNKNSLAKSKSRMLNGGHTEIKGNKLGWWERRGLPKDPSSDIRLGITNTYHKRPDLVSFDFYGTTTLTWLVLQYNNIVDINEEFILGKEISIPSKNRALSELSSKNTVGGIG